MIRNLENGIYIGDPVGQITKTIETTATEDYFDGDGKILKRITNVGSTDPAEKKFYFICSSVFGGQVITEANATGKKLQTNIIAASREIAAQKIEYDENGVITEQQVEWKNYDAFGVSDLRTRKKASETAVTGMDFATMELDPVGLEVRSRQTNQGGGGTIDPEIPMLQNLPEPGAPGGDPDYHGAGGGGIGPLCDIGGPVAVECNRVQIVDGFGRSGAFAMLERLAYLSSQPSGYRNHRRELVTNSDIYGGGRPPANARYGTGKFNESYLLGYETWTTAIYSNWNFAGFLGQTKKQKDLPLSDDDEKKLKDEFDDRLERNDGDCKKKLNELLDELGKSFSNDDGSLTGIEALADLFFTNQKYSLYGTDRVTRDGAADYSNRRIRFKRGNSTTANGFHFIHELLHAANGKNGYTHQAIVRAIASIESLSLSKVIADINSDAKAKKKSGELKKLGITKNQYIEGNYSSIMNSWIGNYCTNEGGYKGWQDFAQDNQ